ncbi:MAG TPA: methyl-accepting chemotaxis protein [Symbiobacteriaceae bacterium]|nr:methyl-accepting chemotaxis protein [Symbiobacteriaceae bacterium]
MRLSSLRVRLTLWFGLLVAVGITVTSVVSIQQVREATSQQTLVTLEYIADQLITALDPHAAAAANPQDFAARAEKMVRKIGDDYFAKQKMSGYATVWANDGSYIFHPKIQGPLNFGTDLGEQGANMMKKAQEVKFNGTVFYMWQNQGEPAAREKFAVLRTIPSKPQWHIQVTAYTDDLLLPYQQVLKNMAFTGLGMVLVGAIVVLILAGTFTKWFRDLEAAIGRVAAGDLTRNAPELERLLQRKDEFGSIARRLDDMTQSLRNMMAQITSDSEALMDASHNLSASSETASEAAAQSAEMTGQIAAGASEQAQSAGSVSTTMAEFQQTISQIAGGATDTAAEVQQAASLLSQMISNMDALSGQVAHIAEAAIQSERSADRGAEAVGSTITGMERIRSSVGEAAHQIQQLESLSGQIGEITEVISSMADQTNLLALNAAIEAARAGEAGRGFAVVAEEVRRLAERSSASARNITDLIRRIQDQTAAAVRAMEAGKSEVAGGSRLADGAGQTLAEIRAMAQGSSAALQAVSDTVKQLHTEAAQVVQAFNTVAAVTEENTAASMVTEAIHRIAGISQESAAATEQVASSVDSLTHAASELASASRGLSDIAKSLQSQVSHFRL